MLNEQQPQQDLLALPALPAWKLRWTSGSTSWYQGLDPIKTNKKQQNQGRWGNRSNFMLVPIWGGNDFGMLNPAIWFCINYRIAKILRPSPSSAWFLPLGGPKLNHHLGCPKFGRERRGANKATTLSSALVRGWETNGGWWHGKDSSLAVGLGMTHPSSQGDDIGDQWWSYRFYGHRCVISLIYGHRLVIDLWYH